MSATITTSVSSSQHLTLMWFIRYHRLLECQAMVTILPMAEIVDIGNMLNKNTVEDLNLRNGNASQRTVHEVIKAATIHAPRRSLTSQEADTVHGLFGSVEGLEIASTTSSGRAQLEQQLGIDVAQGVLKFFEDEWLAQ